MIYFRIECFDVLWCGDKLVEHTWTFLHAGRRRLATCWRTDGNFDDDFITNSLLHVPVKYLKIGEYLDKLWTIYILF